MCFQLIKGSCENFNCGVWNVPEASSIFFFEQKKLIFLQKNFFLIKIEIYALYDWNFHFCEYKRHRTNTGTFEISSSHINNFFFFSTEKSFFFKFLIDKNVIVSQLFMLLHCLFFQELYSFDHIPRKAIRQNICYKPTETLREPMKPGHTVNWKINNKFPRYFLWTFSLWWFFSKKKPKISSESRNWKWKEATREQSSLVSF